MKLSVVIPAYNESDNICHTIGDLNDIIATISNPHCELEIIVVDDCSSDNTYETIVDKNYPHVSILRLSRRSGSHVALRAGLQRVTGEAAICMAADGQDDPKALKYLLAEFHKGYDVVWALRRARKDEPLLQKAFAKSFYKILSWFNKSQMEIDLSRADFYLLSRKVIDAINQCHEKNTSLFGLIIWLGFRQSSIEYDRKSRRFGSSKWNFQSKLNLAKDWIIAFSGLPLRLLTYSGFFIAATGFFYALFVIFSSILFGSPVQGWSSVMTVILILGGGQAIMLGIIGEYLWRTMDETRNRPIFFIEKSSLPERSDQK